MCMQAAPVLHSLGHLLFRHQAGKPRTPKAPSTQYATPLSSFSSSAALFAGVESLAATSHDQPGTSQLVLLDEVCTFGSSEKAGKLFLRAHKGADEDDEARTINMKILDDMMSSAVLRDDSFWKWVRKLKLTDEQVYNALDVDNLPTYRRIFQEYQKYLERVAPHLLTK
ncbi:hypothetical protein PHYSODRAFT_287080 [Phytophthora sojae]|uniref:RxLR effector protein n=1 Tax=Phytophthora sojae (strain P6497) TaxID=1094619 RepID=G5A0J4_PHYSP|nr:hypothetical protein PHYSODRAFT_287080 [Phytophthora sojae]EGZ10530.1 hypothetical protein PHYSODRAFT_287080 [Phytophthora sojae]|eukprot:XP_009533275.1 hypothetical protein PHYSODRAFT_287080 [Phytophthora sojae]